jgi:hypothetical protein
MKHPFDRSTPRPRRGGRIVMRAVGMIVLAASGLVLVPATAQPQLGMLKKLKNKVSAPDSAARAKDSLAQIAAGVKPESVKVEKKGLLARGAAVVSTANGALESATGISAKDAALAATGIGASNLLAKKLGVDPMSIGAQALANAKMTAQQRAMQKAAGGAMGSAGMGMNGVSMQAMQREAMANAARARMAPGASVDPAAMGISQADAEALAAFQQEMMQLSMSASAGDVGARARLEAWQALALRYQPELQRLSLAAGSGDATAAQRMQQLEFDMIREWVHAKPGAAPRR